MFISFSTLDGKGFSLDVTEELEIDALISICALELGIEKQQVSLTFNGYALSEGAKTLKDYGVKEQDLIVIRNSGTSAAPANPMNDPTAMMQAIASKPYMLAMLRQQHPDLADAALAGDVEVFKTLLASQTDLMSDEDRRLMEMLRTDPDSADAQRLIAEQIEHANIQQNMEHAIEYAPEQFGQVVMLYVDCKLNGHHIKAFVDSGAQMTIISKACAERCNIMRLVDRRWAAIARGVGTQKIIGRIHLGQLQLQDAFLPSSFTVLEDQSMDLLIGLDMLRRHQCIIDLKRGYLVIGTTGTEVPFLSEAQLPDYARLNRDLSLAELNPEEQRLLAEVNESKAAAIATHSGSRVASAPAGRSAPPPSATPQAASFPDAVVRELMTYNFSREQVTAALLKHNGDKKKALAFLLATNLRFS